MSIHYFVEFVFLLFFLLAIIGVNRALDRRKDRTIGDALSAWSGNKRALLAIVIGGGIAGGVDILQASIEEGWDIPKVVAAGVLGQQAYVHGGIGTWSLGFFLHFLIAFTAAAVFWTSSRRLSFLTEHWLLCGLYFGASVDLVMHLVVLPLSRLHTQDLDNLLPGLIQKMVVVGLPISLSVRRFTRLDHGGASGKSPN